MTSSADNISIQVYFILRCHQMETSPDEEGSKCGLQVQ